MIIEKGILTNEELIGLYQRSEDDEVKEYCKEQIFLKNERLVKKVASRFRTEEFDDVFQTGCIGLIKAMDTFDSSKGCLFVTHAYMCCKGYIWQFVKEKKTHIKDKIYIDKETEEGYKFDPVVNINYEEEIYLKSIIDSIKEFGDWKFKDKTKVIFDLVANDKYTVDAVVELTGLDKNYISKKKRYMHEVIKNIFKEEYKYITGQVN